MRTAPAARAGTVAAIALAVSLTAPGASGADDRERGPRKPCVTHRLATPYRGYGYDHEVILENTCDHVELCRIESPSADAPLTVEVAGKANKTLVLRRGSPAREFQAKVTCKAK